METVGTRHVWRQWPDIAKLFRGPNDPDWEADRDKIADELRTRTSYPRPRRPAN
ncbi:hypothetical protein KL953_35170 [Mycolicibacterium goodii]|uniref:hypothetical protein n=1 Tax=Mycolicibacterium goodii TaxID=134601 RepID=UPI001BDCBB18|nr:hypothetical protein [Mycolicibacterium goodii]MBU8814103.1 hypothetical protein [Mycolicibacterium goodii]